MYNDNLDIDPKVLFCTLMEFGNSYLPSWKLNFMKNDYKGKVNQVCKGCW